MQSESVKEYGEPEDLQTFVKGPGIRQFTQNLELLTYSNPPEGFNVRISGQACIKWSLLYNVQFPLWAVRNDVESLKWVFKFDFGGWCWKSSPDSKDFMDRQSSLRKEINWNG